jgi:hypothetical protein
MISPSARYERLRPSRAADCPSYDAGVPRRTATGWLAACAIACASSSPSPRWQHGGAQLALETAFLSREDATIELRPSGEVWEEDEVLFRVDRSGRVSDARGEPTAVLMPDGYLVAEDGALLGWVGVGAAYRKDGQTPSVYMFPTGQVFVADEDGQWFGGGQWTHCASAMLWTCTLVTHVLAVRDRAHGRSGGGSSAGDVLKLLELLKLAK